MFTVAKDCGCVLWNAADFSSPCALTRPQWAITQCWHKGFLYYLLLSPCEVFTSVWGKKNQCVTFLCVLWGFFKKKKKVDSTRKDVDVDLHRTI